MEMAILNQDFSSIKGPSNNTIHPIGLGIPDDSMEE